MPDRRKHRGPHPDDERLFREEMWPALQSAVHELSWLLTREYPLGAGLKLVGDRYRLVERQRQAVMRSVCSDQSQSDRAQKQVDRAALAGVTIWIDGFNVITSIEAALSGGIILHGRDGCYRDLASMHGSYRKVSETQPALEVILAALQQWHIAECLWLLDKPVSNSGRLSQLIREIAQARGQDWKTEVVNDPDRRLGATDQIVASADSVILQNCQHWFNLVREVIDDRLPNTRIIPLASVE